MKIGTLITFTLAIAGVQLGCSQLSSTGTAPPVEVKPVTCLPDVPCPPPADPNANVDPYNTPPRQGSQNAGGSSTTPFNPKSPGSTGVTLAADGSIGIDLNGFKNTGAPYIWIANSGEGTESKIDVNTKKQVARYCTYPGCNGDPSRSTVSLQGDVLVANRANYYGVSAPDRASAVKIAGDKSRCVDRNGNGQIDTFEGEGLVPAQFQWAVGQKDSPDECVLWLTSLTKDAAGNTVAFPGTLPRAASFDASIGSDGTLSSVVYVGLYTTREILRMNATTGAIIKRISTPTIQPYGMIIDKDANLWIRGGALVKIDVKNNDAVTSYAESPAGCGYGITADARGYIYTASSNCVARFNPADPTKGWEQYTVPGGACFLRGLALDSKFNLWVADTCNGIYHLDASQPFGGGFTFKRMVSPRGTGNDKYYLGIGLDVNENAWVVSEGTGNLGVRGGSGMVYHIDPTTYVATGVVTGQNPYTYSDMTGAQLRIAGSPFGIYRHTFKSDCAPQKTTWTSVTYTLDTPAGTKVDISGRGAATATALETATFGTVTSIPPAIPGPYKPDTAEGQDNTYLQLQFKLVADSPTKTPTVKNLQAMFTCG